MTSSVFVALRIAASPQRCFDAFTADIGSWWKPNVLFQTTPRKPGVLAFEGELGGRLTETLETGKVFEIGRIVAWEPPVRLVFTWRQASFPLDLHTEVEVVFEPVPEGTRVQVQHRGFDRVPEANAARHRMPDPVLLKHLAEYWRSLLGNLQSDVSRNSFHD